MPLRAGLEGRLTDTRKPQGKRHELVSLVSVLAAGVAAACSGPLAVAQAAAGWDQEVLAAHGCWKSPRTGLRAAPSASMLDGLGKLLDPDELEVALSAVAGIALDPAAPATSPRAARPPLTGRSASSRRSAGRRRCTCSLRSLTCPAWSSPKTGSRKSARRNEVTHFVPLLAPLPLEDVLITSDAMQATRDNALWLRNAKGAHYLWPVLILSFRVSQGCDLQCPVVDSVADGTLTA